MMKISAMVEKGYIFTIHVKTGQNSPQKSFRGTILSCDNIENCVIP